RKVPLTICRAKYIRFNSDCNRFGNFAAICFRSCIVTIPVTPQVRHPERVFLREGSPECGMI
ncbi:MAG: hypothetical protein KGJ07_08540, partial [Patescibacteria group bacterium]|nr:hypothetical protein [Patescibacteria group bacterium]